MTTKDKLAKSQVLAPGYVVALTVKDGTAKQRCYVGMVQAVDEHGIRMTLMDWFAGQFRGWDFFAPWESVTSAMAAAKGHDTVRFLDMAGDLEVWWNNLFQGREAADQAVDKFRKDKQS